MESPGTRLILGIQDIGLSVVNDTKFEEMFYISLTKSKVIWTETKKSRVKPLSAALNEQLEKLHRVHVEESTNSAALVRKKYESEDYEVKHCSVSILSLYLSLSVLKRVMFNGDVAEVITKRGKHKTAKRQALDGLWVDYFWSNTKTMIHVRINRIQIDNQLEYTIFPVLFHPVISKLAANEFGKLDAFNKSRCSSVRSSSGETIHRTECCAIDHTSFHCDTISILQSSHSRIRRESRHRLDRSSAQFHAIRRCALFFVFDRSSFLIFVFLDHSSSGSEHEHRSGTDTEILREYHPTETRWTIE